MDEKEQIMIIYCLKCRYELHYEIFVVISTPFDLMIIRLLFSLQWLNRNLGPTITTFTLSTLLSNGLLTITVKIHPLTTDNSHSSTKAQE